MDAEGVPRPWPRTQRRKRRRKRRRTWVSSAAARSPCVPLGLSGAGRRRGRRPRHGPWHRRPHPSGPRCQGASICLRERRINVDSSVVCTVYVQMREVSSLPRVCGRCQVEESHEDFSTKSDASRAMKSNERRCLIQGSSSSLLLTRARGPQKGKTLTHPRPRAPAARPSPRGRPFRTRPAAPPRPLPRLRGASRRRRPAPWPGCSRSPPTPE